ncbi:MAG: hypothetical protein IK047_03850, partial [Clostridia bacterium]|nr:hypothetical protein [Clostridia bacterium]
TERRIKADTEAVDYSHMFRSWIWGWAGTMYGPISIEYKTYLVKSVCAELKIYEIRTYYCKRENHTVNGAELTYGMLDIPADISEFTEKYPITFENPLGDFLD